MEYTISDFENDPAWRRSLGEKLDKIHYRNGHWHAVCDPHSGICEIHYDKDDPHESLTSLARHMWGSNLGKVALACAAITTIAVTDHYLNDGKIRRQLFG